jgi:alkylated DNA repair dioxygenase AlkB
VALERRDLGDGAFTDYDPVWLAPDRAAALMQSLIDAYDWEQRPINVFGREVMQPRLIAWSGTLPYAYSGQVLEPRPFAEPLLELTAEVSRIAGVELNHVLLNRYRDGNDSMGMHSDDEPELGRDPIIAAISLGAPRRFVMVHKKKKRDRFSLVLENGSLLVMGGTMQHKFRHGVPKQKSVTAQRINVTFRRLLRPPRGVSSAGDASSSSAARLP